ncbi:hypothetical protein Y032_0224g2694 [Ancylostoma ceylanicum]|uniref:Uncharacterized protein n=1 Tax=Ancylostoma ceylanicum TaxID=53326 RepID=A0A016SHA8_9BILA|nr:hypothetical protein Y032_0224g2694 [Ancylostoma ceylanicum]
MILDKGTRSVEIPVTNSLTGANLFRAIGSFETTDIIDEQPITYPGNMLERTAGKVEDREQRLSTFIEEEGEALLKRHSTVFAVTDQELSHTTLFEHNIETGEAASIRQKARPISMTSGAPPNSE